MPNYRKTTLQDEILMLLNKAKEKNAIITVWQSIDDRKIVCQGHIRRIDTEARILLFDPANSVHLTLQKEIDIYVKIDYKDILFKVKLISTFKNTLATQIPTEFHALELRSQKRRKLRLSNINVIGLTALHPLQKRPIKIKMSVLDLSSEGAALLASTEEIQALQEGVSVAIYQFGSKILRIPHMAKIVHIIPMSFHLKIKGHDSFRLGVRFDILMPEGYFQFFEV